MTRPTDQQIEAARVSDLGLILIADFDGLLPFVGHDETYGEFVVWLDCKGEEAEVKCACFLEGPPPRKHGADPGHHASRCSDLRCAGRLTPPQPDIAQLSTN